LVWGTESGNFKDLIMVYL